MKTRDKLINAMNRADLSGFKQTFVLVIFDECGEGAAYEYFNQVTIDNRLKVINA